MSFYVAKIVLANGDIRRPITLFAENDSKAVEQVTEWASPAEGDQIFVQAVIEPGQFGRDDNDRMGIIEHGNVLFSRDGPIGAIKLLTPKQ
ncbi:MAG: hypothetical protein JWQ74_3522 [Marmoricola sp.]|nr:hypothetical protein [Marmoricola sp.]